MTNPDPYYITTAISYVNGAPHLGHAYEAITTDAIARFMRAEGREVMFLTGTDEHGQKVEQTARDAGVEPIEFCNGNAAKFRQMMQLLNISNNDFIRTTEERHVRATQAIWQTLEARGDIYLGKYEGWYSVRDEAFFTEDELVKNDQGEWQTADGKPVEWVEEPSYFFRLSAYQEKLMAFYEANPDFILPRERRNEVFGFVNQGLEDLSISRTTFSWGIPVPGAPEHIVYVWLDALTNYITALGYPDLDAPLFAKFWPADLHVIGKDILRFHAVFWPAFLMSANLPIPKRVFVHGFLNLEGQKMSKSLGNVVTPESLVEAFGLDQLRYFLLREVPFGRDGSYSREAIVHRINGDLANGLGNLAQRTLSMMYKNCDAAVPAPGELTKDDKALLDAVAPTLGQMREAMEKQEIHSALAYVWALIGKADVYLSQQEPWVLRKSDPERMKTVLYVAAETVRNIAILCQPFIPTSSHKLLKMLGYKEQEMTFLKLGENGKLNSGTKIEQPEGLFPRIVDTKES